MIQAALDRHLATADADIARACSQPRSGDVHQSAGVDRHALCAGNLGAVERGARIAGIERAFTACGQTGVEGPGAFALF